MVEYGAGRTCRRKFLLAYFGEQLAQVNCGACDHCLASEAPSPAGSTYDGTVTAQKVLSAIIRTGERFGVSYVVDVLRGSRARRILELGHDRLSVHGIARNTSKDELIDIADQLIERGLVARATGEFPTLSVTPDGREFLKSREKIELFRRTESRPSEKGGSKGHDAALHDAALFEKLRRLRTEIADSLGRSPRTSCFSDADAPPHGVESATNRDSLLDVRGVGEAKADQFGDRFLAAIAEHVAETGATPCTTSPNEEVPAASPTPYERLLSRVFDRPVDLSSLSDTVRDTLRGHVGSVLSTFREGEANVISRRFGLEDGREHTIREIASSLGVSQERVRHIERKALRKLRLPSQMRPLRELLEGACPSWMAPPTAQCRKRPALHRRTACTLTKPGSRIRAHTRCGRQRKSVSLSACSSQAVRSTRLRRSWVASRPPSRRD